MLYLYGMDVKLRSEHLFNSVEYSNQFKETKICFRKENYFPTKYGHDWTIVIESILLSSLNNPDKTKQFFIYEGLQEGLIETIKPDSFIFAPASDWLKNVKDLNAEYFNLAPSTIRFATTDCLQVDLPDSFFSNFEYSLPDIRSLDRNKKTVTILEVINKNKQPLYSGRLKDGILWTYTWFNITENKYLERQSNIKSVIMADLFSRLRQHINIETPRKRGPYLFQLLVTFDNQRYVKVGNPVKITFD
jgi:hypothetical protein